MAEVIRQRAQVFNKPVGVIRTQGGAAQLGQTISRVAGEMADRQYRLASEEAQDVGGKAGMAVASSEIVAIDPETNMPVAYTPPPSFGRIAAASYQDLIDKRFADSLKSELQAKGSEIAASSNSAAQYKDRMSNYVEAMYSADEAPTAYTRMIAEGGTEYIASTYKALRNKEIAAAKKEVMRQAEISAFLDERNISQAINTNVPREAILEAMNNRLTSATAQLKAGGSVADFKKADKFFNDSFSLLANRELSSIYSSLSEINQAKVILALGDADARASISSDTGINDLGVLIGDALISQTSSSLQGGLNAITTAQNSLETAEVSFAKTEGQRVFEVSEAKLTTVTTATEIQSMVSGIENLEVRKEVYGDLFFSMVEKAGDSLIGSDVNLMDQVTAALESQDPSAFDSLPEDVPQQFIDNLKAIPRSDRGDLSKALRDRRDELVSIQANNKAQLEITEQAIAQDNLDNLIVKFYMFDEVKQKELIASLRSPEAFAAFEKSNNIDLSSNYSVAVKTLGFSAVRTALTQVSTDGIADAKARLDAKTGSVNALVAEKKEIVSSATEDVEIRAMVRGLDGKAAQDEAFNKLKLIQVEGAVFDSANTSGVIDKLTIALRNPSPEALEDLKPFMDKGVISDLQDLSTENRRDLAASIETTRSGRNREEQREAARTLADFKARAIALSESANLASDYKKIVSDIESSSVKEKQTLINSIEEKFSGLAYGKFLDLGISDTNSIDRMLLQLRTGSVKDLTASEKNALALLRPMHEINSSGTETKLNNTINEYNALKLEGVRNDNLGYLLRQVNVGERISEGDFKLVEEAIFKGKPQTIATIFDYPEVLNALDNGVMFPALSNAISQAMGGNNEANIRNASALFEKYSKATSVTETGKPIGVDLMRQYLDADTYNLLSAVSFVARNDEMDSVEVLANFRSYGGIAEIDKEIKLNLEIPQSTSVEDGLREYNMSPEYRKEIASVLRIQQSRGVVVSEDAVAKTIKTYTDQMVNDQFTVGNRIGDKVLFSPSMSMTDAQIANNSDQLADLMANSVNKDLDFLLTEGNYGETRNRYINPMTYIAAIGSKVDVGLSGYILSVYAKQNGRVMSGKRALNVQLYYRPLGNTFDTGENVFQVGYMSDNGFEVIAPDGVPWTLSQTPVSEDASHVFRLQSLNNFNSSVNSNATQREQDINHVAYLSSIYEFKADELLKDPEMERFIESIGSKEEVLEILERSEKSMEAMR